MLVGKRRSIQTQTGQQHVDIVQTTVPPPLPPRGYRSQETKTVAGKNDSVLDMHEMTYSYLLNLCCVNQQDMAQMCSKVCSYANV